MSDSVNLSLKMEEIAKNYHILATNDKVSRILEVIKDKASKGYFFVCIETHLSKKMIEILEDNGFDVDLEILGPPSIWRISWKSIVPCDSEDNEEDPQ
jgi:hypothetical protein